YAYLANKPLWEAWYTSNPAYVQVPAPWSALTLWQYGTPALGSQFGVQSGNIDMNWYNGSAAKFEATYPPAGGSTTPIDETKVTHVGVTWSKLIRYGCTVYVQTFDLTKVRLTVHVGWSKVSDAVRNGGAIVGFNGGGWYEGSSISNVVLVSEGLAIQPNPLDGRPFIAFDKGTTKSWFAEGAKPPLADVWNAWGFDRFIGRDGVYNSAITDNTDDARTCWGVTADGKLVALVADGRLSGSPGLSFPEVWAIMNGEFNCVTVGNGDGGDSSTGVDTMLSANPYSVPGEGFENLVLDQVLFYPKEGLPPMAYRYDAVSSLNQMSLRTDHSTLFPRIASYPVNTIVYGNDLFTADKDLYNTAGVLYQKVGDVWLHVLEINGQPVDGWMAIVHMGQRLMVLTDHGVATSWPSYYILENPDGVRQRYNKA
ncbi:MAG TPA: phosphodiester glycosidase family protein, partial [Polyangiaceae bacterium]